MRSSVNMGDTSETLTDAAWDEYQRRWHQGTYRATFFRDMVLSELRRRGPNVVLLDVGCGHRFDGEPGLQDSLAKSADQYLGIEPDASVPVADCFTRVHRCTLEEAPITAASIDVAFAVFVIEHLSHPAAFFERLFEILVPGGVFWGFTIDSRHYFALVSRISEVLGVKGWWLKRVGVAESFRCGNHYRTFYRANTPRTLRRCAMQFRSVRLMNLHQTGQLDAYLPRWAHSASHGLDWIWAALGFPGPMLVVRLEKEARRE